MDNRPHFTTSNDKKHVFLNCSNCEAVIRELSNREKIKITRGYYCKACDDGAIHLNHPH